MQSGELQTVRHCILNYFQDERVRVSVLLREGLQNPDGKFVMPTSGAVPTGTVAQFQLSCTVYYSIMPSI
jgi:hypothetical protein